MWWDDVDVHKTPATRHISHNLEEADVLGLQDPLKQTLKQPPNQPNFERRHKMAPILMPGLA